MKVYTHFDYLESWTTIKNEKVQNGIRWRTLLKYGDSWDIIGSIVMMNPGSSSPKTMEIIEEDTLSHLSSFENGLIGHPWYEFSEDNAMVNVGKLFALKQKVQSRHNLNGVIQIFNLFYLKDPNLDRAKQIYNTLNLPDLLKYDLNCLLYHKNQIVNAPIYLGYGSLAFDKTFRDQAEAFFNCIKQNKGLTYCDYLSDDFEKNKFYYPSYIVGRGKNKYLSKYELGKFLTNKCVLSDKDIIEIKEKYNIDINSNKCTVGSVSALKIKDKPFQLSQTRRKVVEIAILDRFLGYKYDNGHRLKLCNDSSYGITIAEGY